ncbi:MAG: cyclic pyranopterin phosphate synthase MoaA [Gracilibacter sp. BRH_c7a]|nr:MAG: cyclic pyranopterin phosphate synthase MoaA [Gracilibacter sp. BRH_c7a]
MIDNFGRKINYLRVSVTDLCNLRCSYCMPEKGIEKKEHKDIMNLEEIENIIKTAVKLGINKVRITGGEPLVRKGLVPMINNISSLDEMKELTLTTNGTLLKDYADSLKKAGLNRVNISLDTLDREKYKKITRCGNLDDVLEGIRAAKEAKLLPIKINVVLIGGFNDDEIAEFVNLTVKDEIEVRFIELMPLGEASTWPKESFISNEEVLNKVPRLISMPFKGHGTVARMYKLPDSKGKVGLISPVSSHFCNYCNRIRVTPDGKLKSCLHSSQEIDLKGANPRELERLLIEGMRGKPSRHNMGTMHSTETHRNMNEIGG